MNGAGGIASRIRRALQSRDSRRRYWLSSSVVRNYSAYDTVKTIMSTPATEDRFFFCRLVPPRATFAQDITPAEGAAMRSHAAYLAQNMEAGTVMAFGPVDDPAGRWGLALIRARDEAHVQQITADDPVISAGIGCRYEILPMLRAKVKTT